MGLPRFGRPKGFESDSSPNLYVANCGPAVGLSYDSIASVFSAVGELKGVFAADDSGASVIVSDRDESSATAALEAFDGHTSGIQYFSPLHRTLSASKKRRELLAAVDARP